MTKPKYLKTPEIAELMKEFKEICQNLSTIQDQLVMAVLELISLISELKS